MRRSYLHLLGGVLLSLPMLFASCGNGDNALEEIINGGGSGGGSTAVTEITIDLASLDAKYLNDEKTQLKLQVGDEVTLSFNIKPDELADTEVTLTPDDPTIVSIDGKKVKALLVGTTKVTAKAGDKETVCTITVSIPGLLAGKFTINASDDQVQFSQGNLQYQASTNTWRFAENQYDYVGNTVGNNTSTGRDTQTDWIDLFGWGTAGHSFDTGYGTLYQPWETDNSEDTEYGPYNTSYGLYGDYAQGDWGTNAISNGGKTSNSGWRTLTKDEWDYLFSTRSASTVDGIADARYAKANLFGTTHGIILFPDSYTHPDGVTLPTGINDGGATSWDGNSYTTDEWSKLEAAGCVFLPAAGYRGSTTINWVGAQGCYWSSSPDLSANALYVWFFSSNLNPTESDYRSSGYSVRLVRSAE